MGFSFKDFFNKIANNNRIFTSEDIKNMSTKEFIQHEKAIDYQMMNLGIPKNAELMGRDDIVFVQEYLRGDGTVVKAHFRSKPGSMVSLLKEIAKNAKENDKDNLFNIRNYNKAFLTLNESLGAVVVNEAYNGLHHNYPITKELANIFLFGPGNAKSNNDYVFIPKGSAEILNEHYNLTKEEVIPKHWPGILFNETSNISIETSNSFELQNSIRSAYNRQTNKFNTNKIGVTFNANPNLFLSLKNATILEPKIKNGYFTGILFDKYDFEWSNDLYPPYKQRTDWANDFFYALQQTSKNRNYYLLAPIMFKW